MKVKELIEKLNTYNPNANIILTAYNHGYKEFCIGIGGSEGCTKNNCEEVLLNIEELNTMHEDPVICVPTVKKMKFKLSKPIEKEFE